MDSPETEDLYGAVHAVEQEIVSRKAIRQIAIYFLLVMLFYILGSPGPSSIAYIPIQFYLKDRLHFTPEQTSRFFFWAGVPLYVGFLFGYLRDRWKPFGKGDRAYLFISPLAISAGYFWLALRPITYNGLLFATFLSTGFGVLLGATIQGLMTQVAQRNAMAGRLSVIVMVTTNVPSIIAPTAGGWLSDHRSPQFTFYLASALALVVTLMTLWRPHAVFSHEHISEDTKPEAGGESALNIKSVKEILKQLRKPSLYLPAAIMFLWNFSPGWGTPLTYYMTNTVKLTVEQYGSFGSIQNFTMFVVAGVYLLLCRRFKLKRLLWLGTFLGVLGAPLLLLIHGWAAAVCVAIFVGTANSIAISAYYDLLMRACPKSLEAAMFMLGAGMFALASASSDVFGSWLFDRGGFGLALLVTAILTALVLPLLQLLPRHLVDYRDGELHAEPH